MHSTMMTARTAALRRSPILIHLLLYLTCSNAFVIRSTQRFPPRVETRLFATTPRRAVQPLTVGPILGATSPNTARIFGRGSSKEQCIGVVRIRREKDKDYSQERSFRMHPTFDFTGVAVMTSLQENTRYTYQMGFVQIHVGSELVWSSLDWSRIETCTFCTATTKKKDKRSFVLGSGRYLCDEFDDDRGDKTFRSISEQVDDGIETGALLMLGNQIYANNGTLAHFYQQYRDAFTQPYLRALMARIPTYMTLDEHEIAANWPALRNDETTLYPAATHSYLTYQASHSPLFELDGNRITGVPTKLWYTFQDGCCDFFITDCCTERTLTEVNRRMISTEQLTALKEWLSDGAEAVKFVATCTPIFPDTDSTSDDAWSAFCRQRNELLDFIRDNKIPRVVFLSGNVHCSVSARLTSKTDPNLSILSLVSSSFFYPYPNNLWQPQLEGSLHGCNGEYQIERASEVVRVNNFCRVTVTLDDVTFEVFDRKLEKKEYSLKPLRRLTKALSAPVSDSPTLPKPKATATVPKSAEVPVPKPPKETSPPPPKTRSPPSKDVKTVPGSGSLAGVPTKATTQKDDNKDSKPPWSQSSPQINKDDAAASKSDGPAKKPTAKEEKSPKLPWSPLSSQATDSSANCTSAASKTDAPTSKETPSKNEKSVKMPWSPPPPKATSLSIKDTDVVSKTEDAVNNKKSPDEEKEVKLPWSLSPPKADVDAKATKPGTSPDIASKDAKLPWSSSPPQADSPSEESKAVSTSDTAAKDEKKSNLPFSPLPPKASSPREDSKAASMSDVSETLDIPAKDEKKPNLPWSPSPPTAGWSAKTNSPDTPQEASSKDEKKTKLPWSPSPPQASSSSEEPKIASTSDAPKTPSKDEEKVKLPWSPFSPQASSPSDDSKAAPMSNELGSTNVSSQDEKKSTLPFSPSPPTSSAPHSDGNAVSIPGSPVTTSDPKNEKTPNLPWSPSPPHTSSPPKDAGGNNEMKWTPPTPLSKPDTPLKNPETGTEVKDLAVASSGEPAEMNNVEPTEGSSPSDLPTLETSTTVVPGDTSPASPEAAIPTVANTVYEEPVSFEATASMVPQGVPPPPIEPSEPEIFGDGYVSTDNYIYEIGETIEVTYQVFQPREWDYIAIFPASVSENDLHHTNAIQWVNSCENDRRAMNCLGGSARVPFKFPSGRPEKFPLAPGDYNVYFLRLGETDLPNPNEDIIARTSFRVVNSGIRR